MVCRWGKAGVAKARGLGTKLRKMGRKLTARRQIRRANKSLRRQLKVLPLALNLGGRIHNLVTLTSYTSTSGTNRGLSRTWLPLCNLTDSLLLCGSWNMKSSQTVAPVPQRSRLLVRVSKG